MKKLSEVTTAHWALAISLVSASFSVWQIWGQWNTPLQALVYQSQMATIQTIVENARIGCHRRICTDYYHPKNEKMVVCQGDTLDNAFGKVQDGTEALKLIASAKLLSVAVRFRDANNQHALGNDDPNKKVIPENKSGTEAVRFELLNTCQRQVDEFVNEFRATMGLSNLSSALLSRIGESPEHPTLRRDRETP